MTHDYLRLIRLAGMTEEWDAAIKASADDDGALVRYWTIVNAWKLADRYVSKSRVDAKALLEAIGDEESGVMSWIVKFW